MSGQRKLVDAQRWKKVYVDDDCTEDSETVTDCSNVEELCWFLIEKVTDGRDTDGQFLKAISRTETRLSCELPFCVSNFDNKFSTENY